MTDIIGKRFPVLDRGYIELMDMSPHPLTGVTPDSAIVSAARVSFLGESKGHEADKKLLFRLTKDRHTSPFEVPSFTWRVKAPLIAIIQWLRHRHASYSMQSGRYTAYAEDDMYVPDVWRIQSPSNKQGSEGILDPLDNAWLTRSLMGQYEVGYTLYEKALEMGVAREQARLFLSGFGLYYEFIFKTDVHNALHFFKLRMADDAQFEIREFAKTMYNETFKPLCPWTCEAYELCIAGEK